MTLHALLKPKLALGSAAVRERVSPIAEELGSLRWGLLIHAVLRNHQSKVKKGPQMWTEPNNIESTRESENLKSVLLDAITHDFRSPLTSIKVSVTGLLDDLEFDREQRRELLTIINEECDRINRLVGEAAEIARLESGEARLDLASQSVGALLSAALAECKSVTANREICLDVKHPDSRLLVDLSVAKRVLVHLITNAHLYSSPGTPIRIVTEVWDRLHNISVSDQGPGIDSTEIDLIFEKYYRGKEQRFRVHGTGIGLSIAKAIVESHGGTLSVVSRPGQGSVFTFTLPTAQ